MAIRPTCKSTKKQEKEIEIREKEKIISASVAHKFLGRAIESV